VRFIFSMRVDAAQHFATMQHTVGVDAAYEVLLLDSRAGGA
jgi:hypothetical protein